MCILKDFVSEECVQEVDGSRKQMSVEGLVELDRTSNTGTRLNGTLMDSVCVNNDELQW